MPSPTQEPSAVKLIIFVCLIITVVLGIYIERLQPEISSTRSCNLHNQTCVFEGKSSDFSIIFLQAPELEEELFVEFVLPKGEKVRKAWVEGVNMYMGTIPVIFDDPVLLQHETKGDGHKLGLFFLGSCTEPDMRWVLFVELESKDMRALNGEPLDNDKKNTEQTNLYSVFFETSLY